MANDDEKAIAGEQVLVQMQVAFRAEIHFDCLSIEPLEERELPTLPLLAVAVEVASRAPQEREAEAIG
jgi:hypothetical protein